MSDRIALVTGAPGTIGSAICAELVQSGFNVIANFKDEEKAARDLAERLSTGSQKVHIARADLTRADDVRNLFQMIDQQWGRLDVLINNAGIIRDRSLEKMTHTEWDDVIATDLTAVFSCLHHAISRMKKANFGRIVNISSVVALTGNFGQANYCAAKAGLIGLTKAVALETARYNITVNSVAPGFIESRMVSSIPDEVKETLLKRIPKQRFGTAEEVAKVVLFLVNSGDYLTGETVVIDGGWSLS